MARQKQEDPPAGSPAWMATFSDLMNLLLCFFVLLFSMSSVDQNKFQALIASLQSTYSILDGGGASIGDGKMVSAGISQLQKYDVYFNPKMNNSGDGESDSSKKDIVHDNAEDDGQDTQPESGDAQQEGEVTAGGTVQEGEDLAGGMTAEQAEEIYEEEQLAESEQMADKIEKLLNKYGIQDRVEVDFNGQYVMLTLNGAILFESGRAELAESAQPLMRKVGKILERYSDRVIEIEGHTDNVPIHNERFADNNVLSMHRALSVADYLRSVTSLNPAHLKSSGRGEYMPIADNSTPEGRAQNRRVVIKVYNSMNSDV